MQEAAICKTEVSELPEYTAKLRAEAQDIAATEFNRQSLRGGWPFPLLPEPKHFIFGGIASLFGMIRGFFSP
jgi:hypothetical protein